MESAPTDIIYYILYASICCISDVWHPNLLRAVCKRWKSVYDNMATDRLKIVMKSGEIYTLDIISWVLALLLKSDKRWSEFTIMFENPDNVIISREVKKSYGCKLFGMNISRSENKFFIYFSIGSEHNRFQIAKMAHEWLMSGGVKGIGMASSVKLGEYIVKLNIRELQKLINFMFEYVREDTNVLFGLDKAGIVLPSDMKISRYCIWDFPFKKEIYGIDWSVHKIDFDKFVDSFQEHRVATDFVQLFDENNVCVYSMF